MSETVMIDTLAGDDAFSGYVARPQSEPEAAVVVIQEIFGVNAGIRRKCDRLAEEGYLAVAPDLFWQLERDVVLDPDVEAEFQRALELMGRFDQDAGVRDIEATIRFIRRMEGIEKVGAVGYCLGGRLAFMTAARTDADASVGYYAVGIDNLLREKEAIANPLLLHIAGDDGFVDKATQQAMHEGLDGHPKVTLYDYPGMNHGFATEFGDRRDETNAQLADQRTSAFLAQHLRGG